MKKIAIVGASYRCMTMFVDNALRDYADSVEFVGVYDPNAKRGKFLSDRAGKSCRFFDSFDKMLDESKPDSVLVTCIDSAHHEYIIRALEKGLDVISEKPITNTFERCLAIREAEKKAGKKVTVTFNCRFMPYYAEIKKLVSEGRIGKPLAMNYEYFLNREHGGDYFQRWHRLSEFSEGMLLHKSTHHFDFANWVIGDNPSVVTALGNRVFYGDKKKSFAARCRDCKHTRCETYKAVGDARYPDAAAFKDLYFDSEDEDGYIRDRCAYLPDTDICDNMSVSVMYEKGTLLTYSLNMFAHREGARICITGEKGTLLANAGEGDTNEITILYGEGKSEKISFPKDKSSHAGGDSRLLSMIFGDAQDDPLGKKADSFEGFKSAMVGIAANKSIKEGKTVYLKEYLDKLG